MTDGLAGYLRDRHVVVVLGAGGVGKTTCSAALGLAAAKAGLSTVVVTVDPAKRLADALGIEHLDNEPRQIEGAGEGRLWAMMLDQQQTFDDLVRRTARSESQAMTILNNRFYLNISGVLSGTQEYMAAEKLHQLQSDERFDLIIVDTPPARHALDLLDAPQRLVKFLEHPIYRLLTVPSRSVFKAFGLAGRTFVWSVSKVIGKDLLKDAVAFFQAFEGMDEGFRKRAETVSTSLTSPSTGYTIVTTPRFVAVEESLHLLGALGSGRSTELVIANQRHAKPPSLELPEVDEYSSLSEIFEIYRDSQTLASSEDTALARFKKSAPSTCRWIDIARAESDIHSLGQLDEMAEQLLTQ